NKTTLGQILVNEVKQLYHALASSVSLEPSDFVNSIFTKLVDICISHRDPEMARRVLKHPDIQRLTPHLRSLCATGEYLLELQWAMKLTADHTEYQISDFTYADNYKLLVRLELHALLGIGAHISHIVFIGSGPLPLSSIEMVRQAPSIGRIDNVDRCRDAITVSTALAQRLNLDDKLQFYCQDAIKFEHYGSADVIVLGALVGSDNTEKGAFLCHIIEQMKSGAILMVRSAHALRELLYPSCRLEQPGLEPLVEIHPQNEVVNSVVLAQKI
ncbi:Nicotianamine synthase, partial [Zychaea mexicana]|uniref:Nicotianamine synthase n=1 Tax=Zychaea mexicana TaxID=64656 RepID=UPI0022FED213